MTPYAPQEAGILSPFPSEQWEQYVTDADPRQLGIVDVEAAQSLTPRDVIDQVIQRRDESKRARDTYGLPDDWAFYEDQYHFRVHDPYKESWQPDVQVPEVYNRIKQTHSMIKSALADPVRFFAVIAKRRVDVDSPLIRFIGDLMELQLELADFRREALGYALEEGLLLGTMVVKASLEDVINYCPRVVNRPLFADPMMAFQAAMRGMPTTQPVVEAAPEHRRRLAIRHVPLRWAYPDPRAGTTKKFGYFAEEFMLPEEDIRDRVALGIYDSMEDLGSPMNLREDQRSLAWWSQNRADRETGRRAHAVTEYTGDIFTRDGKLVARNWIATVANEKALLRFRHNPIWSGKSRYVLGTPIPCEGRVWGRSIVEAVSEFQEEMSDLLNLMLTDARYSVIPTFVLNTSKLDDPNQTFTQAPGMFWKGRDKGVVEKIDFPSQANMLWPMFQGLERLGDKSSPVTEWSSGTPTARGRASASEAQIKTQNAQSFMAEVSNDLETGFIEPILELVYELVVQFGDESGDPRMSDLLEEWGGPESFRDDLFRYSLLNVPHKIQVKGISLMAQREQTLTRLMQTIQLVSQMLAQMSLPPLDLMESIYTVIMTQGFTPQQFGLPPSSAEWRQMLQMQMAQQQQLQMMGLPPMGGSGGGVGGQMGAAPEQPPTGTPGPPSPEATMLQMQGQSAPLPG